MNTISELLWVSIEEHASAEAVVDNGALTYGELAHNAACVASALDRIGARRGDFVGIYMSRSKEYITAVVACLLFGYGAVLLDTDYPADRIDYMLRDSGAKAVVDSSFFARALAENVPAAPVPVPPDTNALVVYTSGSTGRPKGVLHDQESVHNAIRRFMRALDYSAEDVYGSTGPYTFIAIGVDVLYPLCVGARICVVPRDAVRIPKAFSEYIEAHHITATYIPPKTLKVFQKTGTSLRIAITGSEKVSNIAPNGFHIFNLYGMSEGFPSISIFEIDRAYETTPIGRGDGTLGIYLLDEQGNPAEEGEICVSGHLFTGYLNLSEQTARVRCENPFYARDGHKTLFHTNDMGRRLPDGNIEYVNRKDWMIKINGFRVEPGEIEGVIKGVPRVFDSVVKGFIRKNGTPYLAAYYVEREPVSVEEIRGALLNDLPYYMIPTYFTRLEALPVNNNGKLDHKALAEPETANIAANYVKPATEVQTRLCAAMAELLSVRKVGIRDDFFALGGDYEGAVYLSEQFRELGIDEKRIYQCRTVENITAALTQPGEEELEAENMRALALPQKLTAAQQYYLDYQMIDPSDKLTNNCISVDVPAGRIGITALTELLEACLRRHPALSTILRFDENGEVVQEYREGRIAAVECFTCDEETYQRTTRDTRARMLPALNRLPYYCSIHSSAAYHHVFLDVHRSVCDRQSLAILLKDALDAALGRATASDYCYMYLSRMNLRKEKDPGDAAKQISAFLEDKNYAGLPRHAAACAQMKRADFTREAPRTAGEYERAFLAHHTPVEQVLVAAGLLALGRDNGCDRAAVSWIFSGRDEAWKKNVVGALSAAIPICATISEHTSLIGLLRNVQDSQNMGISRSEHLSFLGGNPGSSDLLEIEYVEDRTSISDTLTGLGITMRQNDNRSNQFRVLAIGGAEERPLRLRFSYNAACYARDEAERFADLFVKAFDICCFGTLRDWD